MADVLLFVVVVLVIAPSFVAAAFLGGKARQLKKPSRIGTHDG